MRLGNDSLGRFAVCFLDTTMSTLCLAATLMDCATNTAFSRRTNTDCDAQLVFAMPVDTPIRDFARPKPKIISIQVVVSIFCFYFGESIRMLLFLQSTTATKFKRFWKVE